MSEGIRRRTLPDPGPLDERGASLEASIRLKLDRGAPLDDEERAFLAHLPARREIPPEDIQRSAERAGGVEPIDAATGRPHVAKPPGESDDRNLRPPHDGDTRAA